MNSDGMIRRLFALSALALAVIAYTSSASGKRGKMETAPVAERQFSHEKHAQTVRVECSRCHKADDDGAWTTQGKKEHSRCFDCHKFSSNCGSLAKKEGKVCLTCHVNFKSSCTPTGYTPPAAGQEEFTATYSHKLHIRPSANSGEQCEKCHGDFGVSAPQQGSLAQGHALCSGCHGRGVAPRIKESCDGCHKNSGTSTAVVATRLKSPFAVSAKFDHRSHAQIGKVGTSGRDCLTCHENIKSAASDDQVPMPTMQGCRESCHDGKKAFDALGTTCTSCHSQGGR